MLDYIGRLIIEQMELKERIRKINEFLKSDKFSALSETEKNLLKMQGNAMRAYLDILKKRLNNHFKKKYADEFGNIASDFLMKNTSLPVETICELEDLLNNKNK